MIALKTSLLICFAFVLSIQTTPASSLSSDAAAITASAAAATTLDLTAYIDQPKFRVVNLVVGGKSWPFLFDSGAGITIISPDIVKAIGCHPFGRLTGYTHAGTRIDLKQCGDITLTNGRTTLYATAAVFNMEELIGGPTNLAGVLALDAFRGKALTMDTGGNRLIVESSHSLKERIKTMKQIAFRQSAEGGGAALAAFVGIEGVHRAWFELDTGDVGPTLIATHALEQLGLAPESVSVDPKTGPLTLNVSGLGAVSVEAARKDMIIDGLVNAETLSHLIVTLDLKSGRAWAARR